MGWHAIAHCPEADLRLGSLWSWDSVNINPREAGNVFILKPTDDLASAFSSLPSGCVIILSPGTYDYNTFISPPSNCTILGNPGSSIIRRTADVNISTNSSFIIRGVQFTELSDYAYPMLSLNAGQQWVDSCYFVGQGPNIDGITKAAINPSNASFDVWITNNKIYNCGCGIYSQHYSGAAGQRAAYIGNYIELVQNSASTLYGIYMDFSGHDSNSRVYNHLVIGNRIKLNAAAGYGCYGVHLLYSTSYANTYQHAFCISSNEVWIADTGAANLISYWVAGNASDRKLQQIRCANNVAHGGHYGYKFDHVDHVTFMGNVSQYQTSYGFYATGSATECIGVGNSVQTWSYVSGWAWSSSNT